MKSIDFLTNQGVDVAKSLEVFGDIETYNQTIGDFKAALEEKIPKLTELKDQRDMANYAIVVHSMKSDAKYFGFFDLADIAYKHELASKEGNITFVDNDFDNLMAKANASLELVKQYMEEDGTTSSAPVESENSSGNNEYEITVPTIIVADDSNIVRRFVDKSFKEKYNVISTVDDEETINILNANISNKNVKCLLLDLNMPRKSGYDVLEFMKQKNLFPMIPVSIITGEATKDGIEKAFTYPVVDMLQKPFTEEAVRVLVNKTIESSDWI